MMGKMLETLTDKERDAVRLSVQPERPFGEETWTFVSPPLFPFERLFRRVA
jgi:hypothetical protein